MTTPIHLTIRKGHRQGFSLVEVALSLAIVAFASVSMASLIPYGLTSFRQAMNNTVESEIVQQLTNQISMSDFSSLPSMAGTTYYFSSEGDPLTSAAGAIYTAQISFTDISKANAIGPLSNSNLMDPGAGTTALITITKLNKSKDYSSVVVGNNRQVVANSTAAGL